METQTASRTLPYAVIAAGAALAFTAAVVPFYGAGYRLLPDVLLWGLLPYMIYALAVPLLRGSLPTVVGLVLVVLHAALVISERFVQRADYADGLIYFGPVVLALALLPLVWRALRAPWGAEPGAGR